MSKFVKRTLIALGLCLVPVVPSASWGQAATGRLLVTVLDQTGGVLSGATVTAVGLEDATRKVAAAPAKANERGIATLERLVPGRYSLETEFSGFEKGLVKEVRVRAGDNRQTVILALSRLTESTSAEVDHQEAASDRGLTFGNALTREQVEALSEDPTELRNQLLAMAGDPNATIRVDSFEGQQLPPKAMIKSVRITRDQFSAENHFAGGISIEVITQPGVGPLRGNVRLGFYDSALDGKNPLVNQRPPGQNRNVGAGISGSLLQNRASFSLNVGAGDTSQVNPFYYYDAGGLVAGNGIRAVNRNNSVGANIDYAVTRDQTIRFGINQFTNASDDSGVGGFNLLERAYSSRNSTSGFRLQEVGPVGRRFFLNTRLFVSWNNNSQRSAFEAPTIQVLESFTSGGAQQKGGTKTRTFTLASDLDYVRGRHSVKMGLLFDGTSYRTDSINNYLGTYTFESLEAYNAGRPRSYTQRLGDPNIRYSNLQAGLYFLDDMRLRKNLTITTGLRYEAQTHLKDYLNFGPRAGITWAPFKSGKTTLRVSWGIFHDWLSTGTYEQTLRLDGFHQQSVNIANPEYPDPGLLVALPTDKYLLSSDLLMPRTMRLNFGVQQTLNQRFNVGMNYADMRGTDLFVGRNLNAPERGLRSDPDFVNIIEAVSAGRSRFQSLSVNASVNLAKPTDQANTRRFVWTRGLQVFANYGTGRFQNNTSGPFSLPATGNLEDEWGPSPEDIRHRLNFGLYTTMLRNFSASLNFNGSSARPLNITTGTDDNGDLVFNDRPAGVGRNSARTSSQWNSSASFNYSIALGSRTVTSGGGVSISMVNGVPVASVMGGPSTPRYRLNLSVYINNLTNHANFGGYSGVMTSRLFLKPISAAGVRNVTFNAGLTF